MKKFLLLTILFISLLHAGFPIPSRELIKNARYYNLKSVTYQGEVIGDMIYTDNKQNVWLNIHDGENAIGVWLPKELAQKIKFRGDYFHRGDIVEITGEFNQACALHGGDLDIHAKTLDIIKSGYKFNRKYNQQVTPLAIISGLLLLITGFLHYWIFNKEEN